jgi:hypothetical protein
MPRKRHVAVIEQFLTLAKDIPPQDQLALNDAKVAALTATGFGGVNATRDREKRLKAFEKIWANPGTTEYLADYWGISVPASDGDIIGRYARRLDQIVMQHEDPKLALDALKFALKTVLPVQTTRIQSQSQVLTMHVSDPPMGFDEAPTMKASRIIQGTGLSEMKLVQSNTISSNDPPDDEEED